MAIESIGGDVITVSLSDIAWPVEADMPVLRAQDGSIRPYAGAFFDEEDGVYKALAFEGGRFVLHERPEPLDARELKAFLSALVETNDPAMGDALDAAIEDLLMKGETGLAFALMNRREALSPSKSMAAMKARFAKAASARAARRGGVRPPAALYSSSQRT